MDVQTSTVSRISKGGGGNPAIAASFALFALCSLCDNVCAQTNSREFTLGAPVDYDPFKGRELQPGELSKLKLAEVMQIDANEKTPGMFGAWWRVIVSNFGTVPVHSITIGYTNRWWLWSCPESKNDYDGLYQMDVDVGRGDSKTRHVTLSGEARHFCIVAGTSFSSPPTPPN